MRIRNPTGNRFENGMLGGLSRAAQQGQSPVQQDHLHFPRIVKYFCASDVKEGLMLYSVYRHSEIKYDRVATSKLLLSVQSFSWTG